MFIGSSLFRFVCGPMTRVSCVCWTFSATNMSVTTNNIQLNIKALKNNYNDGNKTTKRNYSWTRSKTGSQSHLLYFILLFYFFVFCFIPFHQYEFQRGVPDMMLSRLYCWPRHIGIISQFIIIVQIHMWERAYVLRIKYRGSRAGP